MNAACDTCHRDVPMVTLAKVSGDWLCELCRRAISGVRLDGEDGSERSEV